MSVIHLQCCENQSIFEIEYSIGTTYFVCDHCLEKPHFQRGIKNKKEIGRVAKPSQSQVNTNTLTEMSDTC